jgi:NTP pyrophosphatase (non-canonical NTP hydrolase)
MNKIEHLFACLSEECGEAIHAIGKVQRFGGDDMWPEIGVTNAEQVHRELLDIVAVAELLRECGALPQTHRASEIIELKKNKVRRMMEYAIERGTVQLLKTD